MTAGLRWATRNYSRILVALSILLSAFIGALFDWPAAGCGFLMWMFGGYAMFVYLYNQHLVVRPGELALSPKEAAELIDQSIQALLHPKGVE